MSNFTTNAQSKFGFVVGFGKSILRDDDETENALAGQSGTKIIADKVP